ncbi:MAG: SurA N-terminal domain-containing protein [Candidatus Binatia bacterium]
MSRRALGAAGALLAFLAGAAGAADDVSVAATVNGTAITDAMVNDVVKSVIAGMPAPPDSDQIAQLHEAALASLIDLELLYQTAQAKQIKVTEQAVDTEIARSREQFPSQAAFDAALKQSGMTMAQLRDDTRKTLVVHQLLEAQVWKDVPAPSEDALRKFYDDNKAAIAQQSPEAAAAPYEAVKPSIKEALLDQAREQKQQTYVTELRRTAQIARRPVGAPPTQAAPAAPVAATPPAQ